MKMIHTKIKRLFKKKVFLILFFLITFFCIPNLVKAAYFNYADFNFDEFAEENKNYWSGMCVSSEDQEKCISLVLSRQKIFYTRLYKLLAKYQRRYTAIDDNIIIATVFYGLNNDLFTDEGLDYKKIVDLDSKAYNYDTNNDLDNYDIDAEITDYEAFAKEADTLELLIKNMFSYSSTCYAVYGDVSKQMQEDGTYIDVCFSGGNPSNVNEKYVCAETLDTKYIGFGEHLASKFGLTNFFGIKSAGRKECDELGKNLTSGKTEYIASKEKQYSIEKYWEFLETSNYFDKKSHLKNYFSGVLSKSGYNSMIELINENPDYIVEYEEELLTARKKIVANIKSIIRTHGEGAETANLSNINNSLYWWPVGGSEVTTNASGKTFALGEPTSLIITSKFGNRTDPVYGGTAFHGGLDIAGPIGTYMIAARPGIVEKVVTGCVTGGDTSCGGGYGNYIIISHADGNYTLYSHLHTDSITVVQNESVEQGQIIGTMGSSGKSTGSHLHFEVRVGSNDSSARVDPLTYISVESPRQSSQGESSDFYNMLICVEGSGPDDGAGNYTVYDDAGNGKGTLTIGPGVTLKYNVERFSKRGIDVSNYNYVGAKISKEIVDDIKTEIMSGLFDSVNTTISKAGITLLQHQVDALVLRQFNVGNISSFAKNYQSYGNTQALYDNYMVKPQTAVGFTGNVLKSRREREWNLFHKGIYFTC